MVLLLYEIDSLNIMVNFKEDTLGLQNTKEIVEPLASEINNKIEEPQEWLDMERENSYDQVGLMFADIQEGQTAYGIQNWLRKLVNPYIVEANLPEIESSEIESLQYVNFFSETASKVAGKEIMRPILMFSDISEYQNFSIKLRGKSSAASRGMNIPGSLFSSGPLHKTGLIISTDNKEYNNHEVFHSIDPNLEERLGYDRILTEMFANYQQIIVEANLKYYRHLPKPEDGPWGTLSREIDETYLDKFLEDTDEKLSNEEFKQLMKDIVAVIRSIYEKNGHIETQRTIAKSKTIEELFRFSA